MCEGKDDVLFFVGRGKGGAQSSTSVTENLYFNHLSALSTVTVLTFAI